MAKKIKLDKKDNDFIGSGKDEIIIGKAGDDSISGAGGNDNIKGGAGNDVLKGGRGADKLIGGAGDDILFGGADDDVLNGGAGNNTVDGGEGDDTVILGGNLADATITKDGDTWTIVTAGGTTTVTGVELFRFADGTVTADALEPTEPGEGDTLTLTVGVDEKTGTDGNDTFRAVVADSLEAFDILDGGAGDDVLTIDADGLTAGAPVISGIERINNAEFGVAFDLTSVTGLEELWSNGAAGTYDYDNGTLAAVYGAAVTAASTINVDILESTAGAADTLKLAADDNNGNLATFDSTTDAATFEALSISALGGAGAAATGDAIDDLINVNAFTAVKSITVDGTGDIGIDASTITTITTVDASAATGAVTISVAAAAAAVTYTGGAGVDTVTTGAGADVINAGAGNDVIVAGAGNDTINGGAGADTMTGGLNADTFGIEGGVTIGTYDIITDFTTADDFLEFGGAAGSATNYTELAAQATFTEAREAADNALDGTVIYAAVDVGANSYVFFDSNGDGTADAAVQLTGVTVAAGIEFADIL